MIFKKLFGRKKDDEWDDDDFEVATTSVASEDANVLTQMATRARAFADYNRRKLDSIAAKLKDLDREIFHILPALVHLNVPGLPGSFEDEAREHGGVADFRVEPPIVRLLQNHFSSAELTPLAMDQSVRGKNKILSLSAMGSLATIAQTSKSDFDIWVCLNKKDFSDEYLAALAEKFAAIEEWTEKKNHFECHFFITDIGEARANRFGSSDSESAGSALGKLLKEEFFRTHTVLAGYPPLWTAMPSNISNEEYDRLAELVHHTYQLEGGKYINLGTAEHISLEEAFGAALWQLNKALGSPFKSAMKMGLIEDYMDSGSDSPLLCDQLKDTLLDIASQPRQADDADSLGPDSLLGGHPRRFEIDGYLLMFGRILDYYQRKGQSEQIDILRKCFYLKVGETITGIFDPQREKSPRKDMLAQLIEQWGWENEQILDLNAYKEWPFNKSLNLGKQVNGFIIESYKRLSQSGATSSVQINPTDLTVLGRKLFTFYSRKDNKVDFLPKSFEDSLHQEQLTFTFTPSSKGDSIWRVFRGSVSPADLKGQTGKDQLLRQTRNLASLLMWLVLNGIWDKSTHINLISKESPVSTAHLQDILGALLAFFPHIDVAHLPNEDLLGEARVKHVFALLNLGVRGAPDKVARIDLLYDTSWGEVFAAHPGKAVDRLGALRFGLEQIPRDGRPVEEVFQLHIPAGKTGVASRQLSVDFGQICLEAAKFFYEEEFPPGAARCYIFPEGHGVATLTWSDEKVRAARYLSFEDFFLKRERGAYERVEYRVMASPTKLLPEQAMTGAFEEGRIQVFVRDDGVKARVYIRDEMGGTSFLTVPPKAWPSAGIRLGDFLEKTAARIAREPGRAEKQLPPPGVSFYHVGIAAPHHDRFEVQDATPQYVGTGKARYDIPAVREERQGDGKSAILFDTGGEVFSSADHGGGIFRAVAAHLAARREKNPGRPISVGEVDLPQPFRKKNCPNGAKTTHYLLYRKMLEGKLNQALQSL